MYRRKTILPKLQREQAIWLILGLFVVVLLGSFLHQMELNPQPHSHACLVCHFLSETPTISKNPPPVPPIIQCSTILPQVEQSHHSSPVALLRLSPSHSPPA